MRCYNGAWDSQAMALFAEQDTLMNAIRTIEPEAHCTYHPDGEQFQVHKWGKPLSRFHHSRIAALTEAKARLAAIVWC